MKRLVLVGLGVVAFSALACTVESEPDPGPAAGQGGEAGVEPKAPLTEVSHGGGSCVAVERSFEIDEPFHIENCSSVEYGTNPPSSGTHYGTWAAFRNYDNAVPRGFWVHSLEHGAVVIAYSCSDCADEVAAAEAVILAVGPDPLCCTDASCETGPSRLILTPDPQLDTRWAAASWGHTLTADCLDPEKFANFIQDHRGDAPEGFVCSDGADVSGSPCP